MNEIIAGLFIAGGSTFILIASIGALRMPDFLIRMHSSTKAGTLGAGLVFTGVAFYFSDLGITTRALITIVFLFLTAPVGAHVIGRAAYFLRVPLWEGTLVDELKESLSKKQ